MMRHLPYPKIPARRDGSAPAPAGPWVATEKIHGANLTIATDGEDVRVGKRKAWLERGDDFFGWQLLRVELEEAARAVRRALGVSGPSGVVRLYGELFGGHYPHADVPPAPGALPVQTGVWYAPDVRFALFDVLVDHEHEQTFLAHSEVVELARKAGLFVCPMLARGPRRALEVVLLDRPHDGATWVPALLGMPPLPVNRAEGVVFKPDARAPYADRYIIKRRVLGLDGCEENADRRRGDSLDLNALQSRAAAMITPSRVASARSKVGTAADAIRDEVVLDVLLDLEAVFPRSFQRLTPDDEACLRAHVAGIMARGAW